MQCHGQGALYLGGSLDVSLIRMHEDHHMIQIRIGRGSKVRVSRNFSVQIVDAFFHLKSPGSYKNLVSHFPGQKFLGIIRLYE
jgi:hypothetical protein